MKNYFNVEGNYDLQIQGKNKSGQTTYNHFEANVSFIGEVPSSTFNYGNNFNLLWFKRNDAEIPEKTMKEWKKEFKQFLEINPAEKTPNSYFKEARVDPKGYHKDGFDKWAFHYKNIKSETFWIKEAAIVAVNEL